MDGWIDKTVARFGTEYGGFYYPADLPFLNYDSIVYCVGAGEDISHDITIARVLQCNIHVFDFTPRAIAHVREVQRVLDGDVIAAYNSCLGGGNKSYWDYISGVDREKIILHEYGLGVRDEYVSFYPPEIKTHVSWSSLRPTSGMAQDFPVKSLVSIMAENDHDHLDLLKIDIEGMECTTLDAMIDALIYPTYLSVDFDSARMGQKSESDRVITRLINRGYIIIRSDDYNISFYRPQTILTKDQPCTFQFPKDLFPLHCNSKFYIIGSITKSDLDIIRDSHCHARIFDNTERGHTTNFASQGINTAKITVQFDKLLPLDKKMAAFSDHYIGLLRVGKTHAYETIRSIIRTNIRPYYFVVEAVLTYDQIHTLNGIGYDILWYNQSHWVFRYKYIFDTAIVNKYAILERCRKKPPLYLHDQSQISETWYQNIAENDYVYVITTMLPSFMRQVYPKIQYRFYLVTGDSVRGPRIIQNILNEGYPSKIIHWYASNCDVSHPKITPIPLGIDFHSHIRADKISPHDLEHNLQKISQSSREEKIPKIFVDIQFSIGTNPSDRNAAVNAFGKRNDVYFLPQRLPIIEYWKEMAKYQYVLAALGSGYDTHRLWEALALGCIPIVKRSPVIGVYANLPVYIVDDYNHVDLSKAPTPSCSYPEMTTKYWIEQISLP